MTAGALKPAPPLPIMATAVVLWCAPFLLLGSDLFAIAFGAGAASVAVLLAWSDRAALRLLLRPHRRDVILGLVSGVAMTAVTYPLYDLVGQGFPALPHLVRDAYAQSLPAIDPALALPWLVLILTVEELLWRGALVEALERRWPPWGVAPIALFAYAGAHLATGSWVVVLLALACGAVWLTLRLATGRLVAPLVSHLIWSPVVLVWVPLETV